MQNCTEDVLFNFSKISLRQSINIGLMVATLSQERTNFFVSETGLTMCSLDWTGTH